MAFPIRNQTCDILHYGSSSPDVSSVSFCLREYWPQGHDAAVQSTTVNRWTHIGYFDVPVDIRDAYGPPAVGQDGTGTGYDTIYVPSYPSGTAFYVIFAARHGKGTSADHKRVYLQRTGISSWPTNNL